MGSLDGVIGWVYMGGIVWDRMGVSGGHCMGVHGDIDGYTWGHWMGVHGSYWMGECSLLSSPTS